MAKSVTEQDLEENNMISIGFNNTTFQIIFKMAKLLMWLKSGN